MIVFQGTADEVTPFTSAGVFMTHRQGITFEAVPEGLHEDTFRRAGPAYRAALMHLAGM